MVWTALIAVFLALAQQASVGYTTAYVVLLLPGLSIWYKSFWPLVPFVVLVLLGLLLPAT